MASGIFESIQAIDPRSFEQIVFCNDPKVGLKAIISMHSTALGPAVGGCRMWDYATEAEALTDVLRLSRGMTYKNAISNLKCGGGKAVIIGDSKKNKSKAMLERYGEFVDRLGGNYITAKDVGISAEDLGTIHTKTKHVLGIEGQSSSGDPSPATAWGVYHGMKAAAKHTFGTDSLKGVKIALQGLGAVSFYLLEPLSQEGAKLIGCDIDPAAIQRASKYGVEIVSPEAIYGVDCDIFAPCALGASINSSTIPRLKAKLIAGAANNQLAKSEDGQELFRRKIDYAPDYAINAGGVINIYYEGMVAGGYVRKQAYAHIESIGRTITEILARAKEEGKPPHLIADRIAEERIKREH
jgi:leucine dehydrogenase